MRISSCACMKRFSKMVSVTMEMPSACVISAMYCACRSVAKPGYSSVVMSTGCSPVAVDAKRGDRRHRCVTVHAGLRQFFDQRAQMLGNAAGYQMSPPVMAPAITKVPASMRSAMISCVAPCSFATPWTDDAGARAFDLRAHLHQQGARSVTSGSRAAFSITVSPSASTAAIRMSSVPVTVMRSKTMCAPFNPSGATASI
jgi:hypothetical protein